MVPQHPTVMSFSRFDLDFFTSSLRSHVSWGAMRVSSRAYRGKIWVAVFVGVGRSLVFRTSPMPSHFVPAALQLKVDVLIFDSRTIKLDLQKISTEFHPQCREPPRQLLLQLQRSAAVSSGSFTTSSAPKKKFSYTCISWLAEK